MRRRLLTTLSLLAVLPVLAACGGGGGSTTGGGAQTSKGEPVGGKREESVGAAREGGKTIFTENCGSCHTLAAAGTNGKVGPNLDDLKPDQATVERQVRHGGSGMPAFEGRLSDNSIMVVSRYVARSAGQ